MNALKITQEKQSALRKKAKAEMERMERCVADEEKTKILDAFKNRFNICETITSMKAL